MVMVDWDSHVQQQNPPSLNMPLVQRWWVCTGNHRDSDLPALSSVPTTAMANPVDEVIHYPRQPLTLIREDFQLSNWVAAYPVTRNWVSTGRRDFSFPPVLGIPVVPINYSVSVILINFHSLSRWTSSESFDSLSRISHTPVPRTSLCFKNNDTASAFRLQFHMARSTLDWLWFISWICGNYQFVWYQDMIWNLIMMRPFILFGVLSNSPLGIHQIELN